MPKVTKDDLLLEKVKALVAQEKSYEAAAARLNVNTTTLWRFAKNGTAIVGGGQDPLLFGGEDAVLQLSQ